MKFIPISLALALASGVLPGQETKKESPRPISFMFGMGLTVGGDTLASMTYVDGSESTIKAGGIFYFKAGVDWQMLPRLSVQGTYGIHGDSANAKNGSMEFKRNFLEGIIHWNTTPKQRIGLGIRKTSGAELSSSGDAASVGDFEFDSSMGTLIEYEWFAKNGPRGFGISIRYVSEKYTPTKWNGIAVQGSDIDGSHFGLGISLYL